MTFLPKDYKVPTNSNYFKFIEGKNKFRVLSDAVTGWEYWNTSDKPVRQEEPFEDRPEDIKTDNKGQFRINPFWAFIVWNYEAKRVQIMQLTQKSIMKDIKNYIDEPDWGDPRGYDFVVTRSGSGLETKFQTIATPHTKFSEKVDIGKIDLSKLFNGEDPFKQ